MEGIRLIESPGPSHGRMQSLDTLRGMAILMVIAFHVSIHFRPAPWLGQLANFGNQGVQLFFLVSAITMCFMWEQREAESDRRLKFYIRRFFRIAPLFWLAMCFYGLPLWRGAAGGTMQSADLTQIALTASFLHGFSPSAINKIVPGGWSIAIEMSFYLVFPWLAVRLTAPLRALGFAFVAYLVLGVAATAILERVFGLDPLFLYYSLLTQFPIFPIGMFVYQVALRHEHANVLGIAGIAAAWLLIAFAGKYAFGLGARPAFWVQVFLFAGLIWVMIRHGLHVKALSYVGNLSYSMYLFHFAIIDAAMGLVESELREGTFAYLVASAFVVAATVAVAKLSAVTFEKWSSQIGRTVIARLGRFSAGRAQRA